MSTPTQPNADLSLADSQQRASSNQALAEQLLEISDLLEAQVANPFRVRAYRTAAATIHDLDRDIHQVLEEQGIEGLKQLPGVGVSIATAITQFCQSDRIAMLDRLRGETSVERVFTSVPGIGPELASRIHDELGIESLAELQTAAFDGRLAKVTGMGRKRIQAIQQFCAYRSRQASCPPEETDWVGAAEILSVDQQYRRLAKADRLIRIAPKRFNPKREAWLPILHTYRDHRHYTALYSNTAKAHEFGKTNDWVIIYRDDHDGGGQWTVITSQFGQLKGKRIIRGHEQECKLHYASTADVNHTPVGSPGDLANVTPLGPTTTDFPTQI